MTSAEGEAARATLTRMVRDTEGTAAGRATTASLRTAASLAGGLSSSAASRFTPAMSVSCRWVVLDQVWQLDLEQLAALVVDLKRCVLEREPVMQQLLDVTTALVAVRLHGDKYVRRQRGKT